MLRFPLHGDREGSVESRELDRDLTERHGGGRANQRQVHWMASAHAH
jgi:hypothetical protein